MDIFKRHAMRETAAAKKFIWTQDVHAIIGIYNRRRFMIKPAWILKKHDRYFFMKKEKKLRWILKYSAHVLYKNNWECLDLCDDIANAKRACIFRAVK